MSKFVYPTRADVTDCRTVVRAGPQGGRGDPRPSVGEVVRHRGSHVHGRGRAPRRTRHHPQQALVHTPVPEHRHRRTHVPVVSPPPSGRGADGRYVPDADLVEAVDAVELHLMPWLSIRLEPSALGIRYDERWEHPDVIAWEDRQRMRRSGVEPADRDVDGRRSLRRDRTGCAGAVPARELSRCHEDRPREPTPGHAGRAVAPLGAPPGRAAVPQGPPDPHGVGAGPPGRGVHPSPGRGVRRRLLLAHVPGSLPRPEVERQPYWLPKLQANVARDARIDAALAADGWCAVHVWEHEDPRAASARVVDAVRAAIVHPRRRALLCGRRRTSSRQLAAPRPALARTAQEVVRRLPSSLSWIAATDTPSICSRMMSACPAWRAISSIWCTR